MFLQLFGKILFKRINLELQEIPNCRKNHLAIMDDCLVHSKKKDHMSHLINLFKALIRNGLKISPKKCKLFKTKLNIWDINY